MTLSHCAECGCWLGPAESCLHIAPARTMHWPADFEGVHHSASDLAESNQIPAVADSPFRTAGAPGTAIPHSGGLGRCFVSISDEGHRGQHRIDFSPFHEAPDAR